MGVDNYFSLSPKKSDWKHNNRIALLADLRNAAMQPLFESLPGTFAWTVFINDVYICPTDLLELVYQARKQQADIVTGFDYWIGTYTCWPHRL